jgi:hypothetical protein
VFPAQTEPREQEGLFHEGLVQSRDPEELTTSKLDCVISSIAFPVQATEHVI